MHQRKQAREFWRRVGLKTSRVCTEPHFPPILKMFCMQTVLSDVWSADTQSNKEAILLQPDRAPSYGRVSFSEPVPSRDTFLTYKARRTHDTHVFRTPSLLNI